jgi:hypothetical protein
MAAAGLDCWHEEEGCTMVGIHALTVHGSCPAITLDTACYDVEGFLLSNRSYTECVPVDGFGVLADVLPHAFDIIRSLFVCGRDRYKDSTGWSVGVTAKFEYCPFLISEDTVRLKGL